MKLKVDIGVGGRFHADRLANAMLAHGHDVRLFTSLPRSRFDLPKDRVQSILWPEVIYRLARRLGYEQQGDLFKITRFASRLAQQTLARKPSDIFIGWSSFSWEVLKQKRHRVCAVVRDSTHAVFQDSVLRSESAEFGVPWTDRSSVIERELAEYAAADTIFVLSEFAKQTFIGKGTDPRKLYRLPLGVDTTLFKPRSSEMPSGPLRAVYFGSISLRKGIARLYQAVNRFSAKELELTLIGPTEPALGPKGSLTKRILRTGAPVQWRGPMAQQRLAQLLPQFDVFVLPTLEDGFGQTLVQAMACGLVPISTDRCGAAEVIKHGHNGLKVPAGNSEALYEALRLLVNDRELTRSLKKRVTDLVHEMGWDPYQQRVYQWLEQWQ